jgi:DNA invertase Pin-like site-specific DNA recombinase
MSKQAGLILAAGYLRKSDKKDGYETSLADQKARIKRLKPAEPGARYEIVRWYEDPGVQGWKPTAKRPDYLRMVNDLRERKDFTAILVDDMDRFSRRDPMETVADVQALYELRIRYIHAVNQGLKDLPRDRAMVAMRIAMEANASHEHCVRLSRRIVEKRKDAAEKGLRLGGKAPYGLENVRELVKEPGKEDRWVMTGELKHGDPKKVKTVRLIFDWFANELRSINWIAAELNRRQVPAPSSRGRAWYVKSIRKMLRCRAYRGDFTYNHQPVSRFYAIDDKGQVVSKEEASGPDKRYSREGVYKEPLIDPAIFDAAQARLDTLGEHRSRRKRSYALTGILVCDHCGHTMFGCRQKRSGGKYSPVFYRCGRNAECGQGSCGQWQIREDRILPYTLQTLGQELRDLAKLRTDPPEELKNPDKKRQEVHEQLQAERDELAAKISTAEENLLFIEDARTRKSLDAKITALRDKLEKLDTELEAKPTESGRSTEDLEALARWWDEFMQNAVMAPVFISGKPLTMEDPDNPEDTFPPQRPLGISFAADPLKVNEVLHQLGCEIRLRWKSEGQVKQYQRRDKDGRLQAVTASRHVLFRIRLRVSGI